MIFDLYIFDLDGTLINTEILHYESYKETLEHFNYNKEFTYNEYCKLIHYDDELFKTIVSSELNINYNKFYEYKKDLYIKKLNDNLKLNIYVEDFLTNLFNNNIKTAIVSHSEQDTIDIILKKIPLLKKCNIILSRDDYVNRKPHPECYIKILDYFPECHNPIGFEDSYKGYKSLDETQITSVLVNTEDYYYYKKINATNHINNFLEFNENKIIIKEKLNISEKIDKYINYIIKLKTTFKYPIMNLLSLLLNANKNIYLTGIGKCGHICKKSVSTWQSMGISCHYLNLPDLFHGDFGILKPNDIIIYISNSGNTKELIDCVSYIKEKFNILQIALTINKNNQIRKYVNFCYNISNDIEEIDKINMAPTISSVIFMIFLDMLGVYLAENKELTIEKFQLNHPGGDLGKKSKNIIDYVTIVASGNATRLYPLTKYIPKILITFKGKPFIEYLIEYWQQLCKNIIIIYNKEYDSLIRFYCNKYNNIIYIHFNEATGTADTIHKSITNEYYNKNILFTWCDILPDNIIKDKLINTTIFTYGNECRYYASNNVIYKSNEGNIIGIYYIKNYTGIQKYILGDDICDVFSKNYNNFDIYNLDNLLDIGDMTKFNKYITNNQSRFFNKLTFFDNYVLKEAINEQGYDIIKKEINFYLTLKSLNKKYDFICNIEKINEISFKMNKINAIPLYQIINNENKEKYIKLVYEKLKILHSSECIVPSKTIIKDIIYESSTKIIDRINKIKPLINNFDIKYINGIKVGDINSILEFLKNILINNIPDKYVIIHGDCNFSNILCNNDKIYLIDPRGCFGKTLVYGDPDYDYAKVLYALTGYNDFNNNDLFSIEINNNNLIYHIDNYFNNEDYVIINDRVRAWLVIIWFGLAQYNSNNILKCITSYYNGFYWFNKLFKESLIIQN